MTLSRVTIPLCAGKLDTGQLQVLATSAHILTVEKETIEYFKAVAVTTR